MRDLNSSLEARVIDRTVERDRLWTLSQDMLARANLEGMMSAVSPGWTRVLGWSEEVAEPALRYLHACRGHGANPGGSRHDGGNGTADAVRKPDQRPASGWKWIEWTVAPEKVRTSSPSDAT